jgi:hypothetical protein
VERLLDEIAQHQGVARLDQAAALVDPARLHGGQAEFADEVGNPDTGFGRVRRRL